MKKQKINRAIEILASPMSHEARKLALQSELNVRLIEIWSTKHLPSSHQPKQLKQTVNIQFRKLEIVRRSDNKLVCAETGQAIPTNKRGEIDKARLVDEIVARKWEPCE